jgi:hypothetical protein
MTFRDWSGSYIQLGEENLEKSVGANVQKWVLENETESRNLLLLTYSMEQKFIMHLNLQKL